MAEKNVSANGAAALDVMKEASGEAASQIAAIADMPATRKRATKRQVAEVATAAKAARKAKAGPGDDGATAKAIVLPKLDIRRISIELVGDTPLICHNWNQKAKQAILDKQMGKASAGKEPKDPERDYQESLYLIERREPFERSVFGFPARAFKAAAVEACTSLGRQNVTKVQARQAFHVDGELVPIIGTPRMREDMVRIPMGTADIRHRGEFPEWRAVLTLRYNSRVLTDEQIVNLFNTAGFAVGIGEWRSERDGSFGLFHVA